MAVEKERNFLMLCIVLAFGLPIIILLHRM